MLFTTRRILSAPGASICDSRRILSVAFRLLIPSLLLNRKGVMPLDMRFRHSLGLLVIAFALFEPMLEGAQPSLIALAESGRPEMSTDGIPLPAPSESIVRELAAGETNTYV